MKTFVRALLVVGMLSLVASAPAFANEPKAGHTAHKAEATHAKKAPHNCAKECEGNKEANCAKECEAKVAAHKAAKTEHHAKAHTETQKSTQKS